MGPDEQNKRMRIAESIARGVNANRIIASNVQQTSGPLKSGEGGFTINGDMVIHTQATDAKGILTDMHRTVKARNIANQSDTGAN